MSVPAQDLARLVEYRRLEYRQLVLQHADLPASWRNVSWVEQAACRFAAAPDFGMCEACPVVDPCLAAALLLDDPAELRGCLRRVDRVALWAGLEALAIEMDPWIGRDAS